MVPLFLAGLFALHVYGIQILSSANSSVYESFFDEFMQDQTLERSAAVSVIGENGLLFFKGYGKSNSQASNEVTTSTVFSIADLSRIFQSLSIAMEIEEDLYNVSVNEILDYSHQINDTLIGNYRSYSGLPILTCDEDILVKDLFSYSSGLDYVNLLTKINTDELDEDLICNAPSRIRYPRIVPTESRYDVCYLSKIFEKVFYNKTNTTIEYDEYVKKYLIEPLEMNNTHYSYEKAIEKDESLVSEPFLYSTLEEEIVSTETSAQKLTCQSSHDYYSSSEDMVKLLKMILNEGDGFMSLDKFSLIFDTHFQVNSHPGKGIHFNKKQIGDFEIDYLNGLKAPYASSVFINRENKVAVLVMMNGVREDDNQEARELFHDIHDLFTIKFLVDSEYCSNDANCKTEQYKDTQLSTYVHSEQLSNWYEKDYEQEIGCFINSRYTHTHWLLYLGYLSIKTDSFCISTHENYLRLIKYPYYYSEGEEEEYVLLLRNKNVNVSLAESKDYVIGVINSELSDYFGNEYVDLPYTQEKYSFVYDSNDRKYWVHNDDTYEYVGNENAVAGIFVEIDFVNTYLPFMGIASILFFFVIVLPVVTLIIEKLNDIKKEELKEEEIVKNQKLIEEKTKELEMKKMEKTPEEEKEEKKQKEKEMKYQLKEIMFETKRLIEKNNNKKKVDYEENAAINDYAQIFLTIIGFSIIVVSVFLNSMHYLLGVKLQQTLSTQSGLNSLYDIIMKLPMVSIILLLISTFFVGVVIFMFFSQKRFKVFLKKGFSIHPIFFIQLIHVISLPLFWVLGIVSCVIYSIFVVRLNLFVYNVSV